MGVASRMICFVTNKYLCIISNLSGLAQLALFRDILVRKKKDYSPWALFCFFVLELLCRHMLVGNRAASFCFGTVVCVVSFCFGTGVCVICC